MKNMFIPLLIALLSPVSFSFADEELRLIETEPGKREWMNQAAIDAISMKQHEAGKCAGFMDVTDHPNKGLNQTQSEQMLALSTLVEPRFPEIVEPLLSQLSSQNLSSSVASLSAFQNRYYNSTFGAQSAEWIRSRFVELAHGRTDIEVRAVSHSWMQPSIVARIQGSGSESQAREIVVIGAHQDSISSGSARTMRAPGADDDASGVATVLEIFRVLAESDFRPLRTIEFMAYAGEEAGLLGSQVITEDYRTRNVPVIAALQFDMTLYPGSGDQLSLINDYVNMDLTRFMATLIDRYVGRPWHYTRCGYACSDHSSWTASGYPSVFPFESQFNQMNDNIHSPEDVLSILNPDHGLHFAKLGLSFAVEASLQ